MRPHTSTVPKCLLPVCGRPFADWQLEWLAAEGVEHVVFSIGHLGHEIRSHVGDGSRWSLHVEYVDEGEELLGTGGALGLAAKRDVLDEQFFVIYGDSYLSVHLDSVEETFRSSGCPALMTVFHNSGHWEESNVVFSDGCVRRYEKHSPNPPVDMVYVDYGVLAFQRETVATFSDPPVDLAPILEELSLTGRLAGYEATDRFYEIGSPTGLRALESHLAGR